MYPGYLNSFYALKADLKKKSYKEHLLLLLNDSTDFVASYVKTFNKHGLTAECIIANDNFLQYKWRKENMAGVESNKDLLLNQVISFQPEILWIEDLRFIDREWIENTRRTVKSIRLIIACFCAPFNSIVLKKLSSVDFVLACTPGLKSEFQQHGIRSYLIYHGFDTDLLEKINSMDKCLNDGIIFSGSLFSGAGYHNSRIELIESILKEGINLSLYMNLEKKYKIFTKRTLYSINELIRKLNFEKVRKYIPLLEYGMSPAYNYPDTLIKANKGPEFGLDMYHLIKSSKIVLNNHGDVAGMYAGNMRLFEATGLGSCLLTDNKTNLTDLFDIDNEIVVYNNNIECVEKIKWLSEHDEERKRIALAGQKKTLEAHTVDIRCRTIEAIINEELDNKI